MKQACKEKEMILAPLTGEVLPLSEVPDDVFSAGILGDGVAILPEDGKIYSPDITSMMEILSNSRAFKFCKSPYEYIENMIHESNDI